MAANDTGTQEYGIDQARADLAATIADAGPQSVGTDADAFDGLAKVGSGGFSIELRLNGTTIPLAGQDINEVPAERLAAFLEEHKAKVEAGDLDAEIEAAIGRPGPEKALIRVRAISN